ncbi:MAG TPA: oligosaccharide flippase family protein [Solirubrobacteraceae bacterium]|nr:oligosaccharide flippase family protein [Solirubrobacteraceae bacterium]
MVGYLKRLAASLGAYQLANVLAKVIGVVMLPLYTRYLSTSDYGTIELLANGVILISILVRLGMIEAFLRFYFSDDDVARRDALARRAVAFLLVTTTVVSVVLLVFAEPLSGIVLSHRQPGVFRIAVLGLWSFTNLELTYQLLRVDERLRLYAGASVCNVLLTVAATVTLVVGLGKGPSGYLLGNYGASTVILVSLWWLMRRRLRPGGGWTGSERLSTLMRFGLPTVPAEASVYLLSIIDRYYLYHHRSASLAGIYSIAIKLAGAVAFIVNAFQYAWPPLAYSVTDDAEAGRLYGLVTTYYLLVCGYVVAALALLGRWVLRLLAAPAFFDGYKALPWLALGWALYGLWVVFLTIAGRAKITTRNFPAALLGLVANVVLLVLLVGPLGLAGAGIALCGAYAAMLALMYVLTRRSFAVAFEWGRLARLVVVVGGFAVVGDLLLPTDGALGLLTRLAVCAGIGPALLATGFVHAAELRQVRTLVARVAAGRRAQPEG